MKMKPLLKAFQTLALLCVPAIAVAAGPTRVQSQSNIGSLQEVVTAIFNVLMIFLPSIAVLYIVVAGYRYIISQGNPDLAEKAKKSLSYAVWGVIIAIASVVFIKMVANSLGYQTGWIT